MAANPVDDPEPYDGITYREADDYYVYYENEHTGKVVKVYKGDLASAAHVAQFWHGGQWSPLYRLMSGDLSPVTLNESLSEFEKAAREYQGEDDDESDDGSSYSDLLSVIEDLQRIVKKIDGIRTD